uniref:Carboxylesterase type B domain-containing protein n=1 Tax=Mycena chlorophos TaxID=658473 RepID=A0ABQ0KV19_MYCCL|nr:predicted protein [Mycena chlorophos]
MRPTVGRRVGAGEYRRVRWGPQEDHFVGSERRRHRCRQLLAYPDDPIVRGAVSSSGVSLTQPGNPDYGIGSNFTFIAKSLGCDFEDTSLELECMRRVPMPRIVNFMGQWNDNQSFVNTSQPTVSFMHAADNVTVFSDYTERYRAGKVAKIPQIIGTAANEGAPLAPYPQTDVAAGPNPATVLAITLNFVCPSHSTSVLRNALGLTTY